MYHRDLPLALCCSPYICRPFPDHRKAPPKAQGYADDHQVYLPFRPIPFTKQTASVTTIENCVVKLKSWIISNMLMMNDSKTEFLFVGSKQQLERVNIPFIHAVRIISHLWRQYETWVWFLTPTWKWICKSQRPAKMPTIISTTSGESENSRATKPRAWLYMHLLQARLTTATVWWMDYRRITSRNSSVCKTQLLDLISIWGNMVA